jgi:hypothetical protein
MAMSNAAERGGAAQHTTGLTDEAQALAGNLAQSAKDKALSVVEQQKAAAAAQVDDIARLVDNVAGEVEQGVPAAAPLLREGASRIHRVSSTLRERSTADLLQDASEFARRRPAVVIGACLIGGFALARFLTSSADRRAAMRPTSSDAQPSRPSSEPGTGTAAQPSDPTPSPGATPDRSERSGAALADAPSPAAGMASLADVAPWTSDGDQPSAAPAETSAAGGGAEAPEPSKVGSI